VALGTKRRARLASMPPTSVAQLTINAMKMTGFMASTSIRHVKMGGRLAHVTV
jgi:hypothetical protein